MRAEHNTIEKPWIFYDAIKSFNSENQTNQTEEVFYENGSNGSFSEEVEKTEFSEAVEAIEEETTMDTEPTELSCVFCQGIPKSENATLIDIAEDEKCVEMVDKINFVLFENVSKIFTEIYSFLFVLNQFTEIFDENIYQMICTTCYENVESFYNFKKQSRSSLDKYKKGKKVTTAEIVKHEHNYENKGKRGDTDDKNEPPIKSTSRKRKMKKCCTICQRFFYNLKKHKLIAHTGRPKMKECHYCSKSFAPDQLKNHISMHLDERSFQCSICNRRFVDIKNLQHHVDEMHTADSKKYGCGICGAKFVLAISLKKHFLIHGTGSGLPEVIHKCETCNKVFVSKNGLKMHSLIHELPFACPLCPECFASENSLEIHCVLQHNEPTRKF